MLRVVAQGAPGAPGAEPVALRARAGQAARRSRATGVPPGAAAAAAAPAPRRWRIRCAAGAGDRVSTAAGAARAVPLAARGARLTPAPPAATPSSRRVLAIVAEKTGYPPDMLDLELDLEADLGVDTVKQAETFAAVREAYDIARQENLKLRDFPTLRHVVGVRLRVPSGPEAGSRQRGRPRGRRHRRQPPRRAAPAARSPRRCAVAEPVAQKVLAIVAEKTGYPQDMLELDLDLEADLGVDTVKQAETFAAVREAYGIERQENLKLRDFPTLRTWSASSTSSART